SHARFEARTDALKTQLSAKTHFWESGERGRTEDCKDDGKKKSFCEATSCRQRSNSHSFPNVGNRFPDAIDGGGLALGKLLDRVVIVFSPSVGLKFLLPRQSRFHGFDQFTWSKGFEQKIIGAAGH